MVVGVVDRCSSTGQEWVRDPGSGRSDCLADEHGAKTAWTGSGDGTERASKVALVGKTQLAADVSQRPCRVEHALASLADTQPMNIFPDALAGETPEYPRQVHRMHPRL